jgi:hypothetical protein
MMVLLLSNLFVSAVYDASDYGNITAQTSDTAYTRPLKDVLKSIEARFGIKIKYDAKMIDGKILQNADWRVKPWSAEESLYAVLAPFDYTFSTDNGVYKIKQFEYARTNEVEGKKFLDYLETLYTDKAGWEKRKSELKPCLLSALRLSPLPPRPDSEIILTSERKYDGYSVRNFAIETLPGIYVCGSLYKPLKVKAKCPVILNPNGHFEKGRYREDQQKRCATQARMGAISVSWDLFAWGESSLQFDGSLHRISYANTIQTLNAVRILDDVLTFKEADFGKVAITGGSGGGSMTMLMAATDDRIALSIPVVMLSSYFVGGCPCESGMGEHLCGNRTNNVEIASMFAPKPQLILSDGKDWTSAVPQLEFPFVQRTYGFYGAENNAENIHFREEGHDYGISKRKAAYDFLSKHFGLDAKMADESKVTVEEEKMMYVFGDKGEKLPANAVKGKDELIKVLEEMKIIE